MNEAFRAIEVDALSALSADHHALEILSILAMEMPQVRHVIPGGVPCR